MLCRKKESKEEWKRMERVKERNMNFKKNDRVKHERKKGKQK